MKWGLAIIIFCFAFGLKLSAQTIHLPKNPYTIPTNPFLNNPQKVSSSFNLPKTLVSVEHSTSMLIQPMGSFIHYNAFFCKMEVDVMRKTGVWLKVHAGDYDRYAVGY